MPTSTPTHSFEVASRPRRIWRSSSGICSRPRSAPSACGRFACGRTPRCSWMCEARAMRVELTRVYHFSAAHQLCNPALTPEENERVYGVCAGMHGHNYYVEVAVAGTPDPVTGMVCNLARLDRLVQGEVLDHVD